MSILGDNDTLDIIDHVVDETTDVVDHIVDETTDVVDHIVDETTDVVDHIVDEKTDTVDHVFDGTTINTNATFNVVFLTFGDNGEQTITEVINSFINKTESLAELSITSSGENGSFDLSNFITDSGGDGSGGVGGSGESGGSSSSGESDGSGNTGSSGGSGGSNGSGNSGSSGGSGGSNGSGNSGSSGGSGETSNDLSEDGTLRKLFSFDIVNEKVSAIYEVSDIINTPLSFNFDEINVLIDNDIILGNSTSFGMLMTRYEDKNNDGFFVRSFEQSVISPEGQGPRPHFTDVLRYSPTSGNDLIAVRSDELCLGGDGRDEWIIKGIGDLVIGDFEAGEKINFDLGLGLQNIGQLAGFVTSIGFEGDDFKVIFGAHASLTLIDVDPGLLSLDMIEVWS